MSTDNVEFIERLLGAFHRGGVEGSKECVDPEVSLHAPASLPYGGDHHRVEAFFGYIAGLDPHFKVLMSQHNARAWGDKNVHHMGLTFEAKATDWSADTSAVEIYEFTDERISGIDVFYKDTRRMIKLLGFRADRVFDRSPIAYDRSHALQALSQL